MNVSSRFAGSLALAAALLLSPAATAGDELVLDIPQPTYEIGLPVDFSITGPPGAVTFLFLDFAPGTTVIPFVGTFELAFSPQLIVIPLGAIPAGGTLPLAGALTCRSFLEDVPLYFQAAAQAPGGDILISNPDSFDIAPGDCFANCEGGINQLGLQTELTGVTATTGTLRVTFKDKDVNGVIQGEHIAGIDVNKPELLPFTNASGSVSITKLELDGDVLTVRFCVNAEAAGLVGGMGGMGGMGGGGEEEYKLKANTWFEISYEGSENVEAIHTSCSQAIDLGFVFGEFMITKLIDTK